MAEIWVLGSVLTPEFLGGVADTDSVKNLVPSDAGAFLRKTDADEVGEAAWTFTSTGGPRGIYVLYASQSEQPSKLIVNDQIVQRRALYETTLDGAEWRYQMTADLPAGPNRIALRFNGDLPRIEAVAVAPPPVGQQACVDDAYAALHQDRARGPRSPLVIRPAELAGLVDLGRRLVADDSAHAQLRRVVDRVLVTSRWDSENGFSRIAWGGGPMNGQQYRQRIFNRLMRLGVDAIVETGAYIGASTGFFARQGVPVFSCELQEKYFARAAAHLAEWPLVTLHLEDSRSFLRNLAADPSFGFELPLFYLDAHWEEDLPLAEEIGIISERWPAHVIMVDDFQVPGSNYVYDKYGNGLELTLNYLEKEGVKLDDFAVLFPSASDEVETGAKRGTLVLMPAQLYEQRMSMDRTVFRYRGERR